MGFPGSETYDQSGMADLSFTGMNSDTVGTDYDFLFREYSIQGRWASPDRAGIAAVDITNLQSWNRYSYALNNPLALIDLLGLDPCDDDDASECVVVTADPPVTIGIDPIPAGPLTPPGGGDGNTRPKQTFSQCMTANKSTFSLAGLAQGALNGILNQFGTSVDFQDTFLAQFLGGNTFSILYGSAEDAGSVAATNTPNVLRTAIGTVTTYGRNTSTITSLNIARSGGLP